MNNTQSYRIISCWQGSIEKTIIARNEQEANQKMDEFLDKLSNDDFLNELFLEETSRDIEEK